MHTIRQIACTLALAALTACNTYAPAIPDEPTITLETSAASLGPYRIVGYEPDWANHPINHNRLTHLNYAFVLVNNDGTLNTTGMNLTRMQSVVNAAKQNGVKALISVGGAGNPGMGVAITNPTSRAKLVTSLKAFIAQYGFDGVDLDWEGPSTLAEGNAYLALFQTLSTDLKPNGKLVTTAVGTWFKDFIPNAAFAALDFVNIMSYDGGCPNHSTYAMAQSDLNAWLAKGLPKNKAILGVPFYGEDAIGCQQYTGKSYADIVAVDASAPYKDLSNGYYYNGIATIKQKTQLAIQAGGGIMIWNLAHDTNDATSLLGAINETFAASSATHTNIAPNGTGYIWAANTTAFANTNRTAKPGINDGNTSVSNLLSLGEGGLPMWEAAGVVWAAARTISAVNFVNGGDDGYGNGYFQANTKLQFSTDGVTWADSGWTMAPTYPHNSNAWHKTFAFSGAVRVGVRGVRVVGQMGDSWDASIKEVTALGR